jgi:predicted RecA/RadA family phage recombinase
MEGTVNPNALISLKYLPSDDPTAIENGNVVLVGALVTGEREVFDCETPAANSLVANIALVATPELMADERKKNLNEFRNEAGAICRGYRLRSEDIFSLSADAYTNSTGTTVAAGHVVELAAATKLNITTSLTGGSTQVGTVIAVEDNGNTAYTVIKVS